MFRKQDPYSYTTVETLYLNNSPSTPIAIGLLATEYTVTLFNDVQVVNRASVELPRNQQFIVQAKQRILIKNKTTSNNPTPVSEATKEHYENYPALITTNMNVTAQSGVTLNLLDYSPQTVNTAVQQSTSAGSENSTSSSTSSTTGSSYSQSSTYGTSVSLNTNYALGATSVGYSHSSFNESSTTRGGEQSSSNGLEASSGQQTSTGDSMSIKNWGSYGWVNPDMDYANWTFGQEYPWNAIQCRFAKETFDNQANTYKVITNTNNPNQVEMLIPAYMLSNLYDGTALLPPSELSLYGLNFVMTTAWRVFVDYNTPPQITINHPINYLTASHYLAAASPGGYTPVVYLDSTPINLSVKNDHGHLVDAKLSIDLNVMSLDPVGNNSSSAIVGFIPSRLIPPPNTTGKLISKFRALSTTNDIILDDTTAYTNGGVSGFSVSQTCLTLNLSSTQGYTSQVTLYFKIVDSVKEYSLYLKHWKGSINGVKLTFVINGDTASAITKYIDDLEAEGGDSNVTKIDLRDLDFSSVNYHDYLQLGLNSITMNIEPIENGAAIYQVRAIAIQQG